jgi:hypothetical protein
MPTTRRTKAAKPKEPEEPKTKWKHSRAKALLQKDIMEGRVPLEAKNNGRSTMSLRTIYDSRPELKEYRYSKFSSRLASLRKTIKDRNDRAALDQAAFDNFKQNHPVSVFSAYGYIQWQGSEAQRLCQADLANKVHDTMSRMDFWASRREYYENFPLDAFRNKVWQEIRTAKYLHTLNVKGKDARKHRK